MGKYIMPGLQIASQRRANRRFGHGTHCHRAGPSYRASFLTSAGSVEKGTQKCQGMIPATTFAVGWYCCCQNKFATPGMWKNLVNNGTNYPNLNWLNRTPEFFSPSLVESITIRKDQGQRPGKNHGISSSWCLDIPEPSYTKSNQ